MPLQVMSQRL